MNGVASRPAAIAITRVPVPAATEISVRPSESGKNGVEALLTGGIGDASVRPVAGEKVRSSNGRVYWSKYKLPSAVASTA